jgi:hypothetical protein
MKVEVPSQFMRGFQWYTLLLHLKKLEVPATKETISLPKMPRGREPNRPGEPQDSQQ